MRAYRTVCRLVSPPPRLVASATLSKIGCALFGVSSIVTVRLRDSGRNTKTLVDTLAATLVEVNLVTLGDTRGVAHALVDTLADTLAEVEVMTLGDTRSNAHALVDTSADMLADVKALTLRDTGRCARTGRHSS